MERTSQVKIAKIQMLTSKLENIKMLEGETVNEFYNKITEIVNSPIGLGELSLKDSNLRLWL